MNQIQLKPDTYFRNLDSLFLGASARPEYDFSYSKTDTQTAFSLDYTVFNAFRGWDFGTYISNRYLAHYCKR